MKRLPTGTVANGEDKKRTTDERWHEWRRIIGKDVNLSASDSYPVKIARTIEWQLYLYISAKQAGQLTEARIVQLL